MAKLLKDDVLEKLPRAICNPHLSFDAEVECLPCYNGITGEILFKSPLPGSRRISRQKLREVLTEGLDIKWGRTLGQISFPSDGDVDGPVQLIFDDGHVDEADYVLGTDGGSSKVRELLVGNEAARAQSSGFLIATGIAEYRDADRVAAVVKTHPVAAIAMAMEAVAACGGVFVHASMFPFHSLSHRPRRSLPQLIDIDLSPFSPTRQRSRGHVYLDDILDQDLARQLE